MLWALFSKIESKMKNVCVGTGVPIHTAPCKREQEARASFQFERGSLAMGNYIDYVLKTRGK
jgi:hypothetical protein